MTTPSLSIPVKVTGLQKFRDDMTSTSSTVGTATRAITARVIQMNSGFLASQGAAGAATLAFGRMLSILAPITLGITAITDTFKLMSYAVDLAKTKIGEFNDIATKANAAGVSTDFFQRFTKGAAAAHLSIEDATAALQKFHDASQDKLGGSDLQQAIDQHVKAGNLKGNTGVAQFAAANTYEEKLKAISSLLDQAREKGEGLAALDIGGKAFGSATEGAMRTGAAMSDILRSAKAISSTEIISQADIGRAVELKERMEQAQKILSDKWKPIQDDLASLGMQYHESWVEITEEMAKAVGYATAIYSALKEIPDFLARAGSASFWTKLTNALTTPEGRAQSEQDLGISSDPKEIGMVDARKRLGDALRAHASAQAMEQASGVESKALGGDKSHPLGGKTTTDKNQFDTATDSLTKHIAKMEADTKAVGLGAGALEQYRAQAALMTAATEAGLPVTDAMIAKIQALAKAAGEAGDKLAHAKIDSDIDFGRKTSTLEAGDVAIANQLKSVYGNDVSKALASSEAAAIRFNTALSEVSKTASGALTTGLTDILDGSKSVSASFASMSKIVVRAIEEMIVKMMIVQPLMRTLGGGLGFDGGAVAIKKAHGGMIHGPGTGTSDSIHALVSDGEFIVNAKSTAQHRDLLERINSNTVPRFAAGGVVGDSKAPIANMGATTHVIAPSISVQVQGNPGSSPADHAKMGENIAKAAQDSIQDLIGKELRRQSRPGGTLHRR